MPSAIETDVTLQLDPGRTPANIAEQLRGMGEQEGLEVRDIFQTPSGYFVRVGTTSRIGSRAEDFATAINRFFRKAMAEFGPIRLASPAFFNSKIRLNSIQLTNVKLVSDLRLTSLGEMTVLVGENGAGKTTILDCVSFFLQQLVDTLRAGLSLTGQARKLEAPPVPRQFLKVGAPALSIAVDFEVGTERRTWRLTGEPWGDAFALRCEREALFEIAESMAARVSLGQTVEVPVPLYYRTNRAVFEVPERINLPHVFSREAAFDEAVAADMWQSFRLFFEWFREREDYENEARLKDPSFRDEQLEAVRRALHKMLPEVQNPHIERAPQRFLVEKALESGREMIEVGQLSDGEKVLFVLGADIARRLAIANPGSADPLCSPGIVLIDEVELHLHPRWQRRVVDSLRAAFPNCQFILATHSPQVASAAPPASVVVLSSGKVETRTSAYGRDTNSILENIFNTPERPESFKERIARIGSLVDSGNRTEAMAELNQLARELSDLDPDVVRLHTILSFMDSEHETHTEGR